MIQYKLAKLVETKSLNKRWYVTYNYIDPKTGKFKMPVPKEYIPLGIKTKTKRRLVAKKKIEDINIKLRSGWFVKQQDKKNNKVFIKDAISFVLEYKQYTIRPRSYQTYKDIVNSFYDFLETENYLKLPCAKFDYEKAQEFMDWTKIFKKIKNTTYNNYVKTMRTFFKVLIKRKHITENPFADVELLQVEEAEILFFTKDELKKIRETLPKWNEGLFTVASLIFYTYIRPKEATRLRIENIDMVKKIIRIPAKSSKNKKTQSVAMPDQLYEYLNSINIKQYPPKYRIVSKQLKPGINEIAGQRISEKWREYATKFNIDKRKYIYHLKHTSVGMAVEKGINVRDLQLQLRHSSLEMTQIYIEKFNNIASKEIRTGFPDF